MPDLNGSSDWSPLVEVNFEEKGDQLSEFAELGRQIALHSADALDASLYNLYQTIRATTWLGGNTREGRVKIRRLLRPLGWTVDHSLPAAARRFAALPSRFRHIYAEELHPTVTSRGGMPNPNGRR